MLSSTTEEEQEGFDDLSDTTDDEDAKERFDTDLPKEELSDDRKLEAQPKRKREEDGDSSGYSDSD